MDPRFAPAVETEQSQGLTNEEFDGLRSTLRKSILFQNLKIQIINFI